MRAWGARPGSTRVLIGGFSLVAVLVVAQDLVNHASTSRAAARFPSSQGGASLSEPGLCAAP